MASSLFFKAQDIKQYSKVLKEAISAVNAPDEAKEIANRTIDIITIRTRLGFGVEGTGDNAKKVDLAPLSPVTIKIRQKLAKKKKLHSETKV